jgi:hypothetical protein
MGVQRWMAILSAPVRFARRRSLTSSASVSIADGLPLACRLSIHLRDTLLFLVSRSGTNRFDSADCWR